MLWWVRLSYLEYRFIYLLPFYCYSSRDYLSFLGLEGTPYLSMHLLMAPAFVCVNKLKLLLFSSAYFPDQHFHIFEVERATCVSCAGTCWTKHSDSLRLSDVPFLVSLIVHVSLQHNTHYSYCTQTCTAHWPGLLALSCPYRKNFVG